MKLYWGGISKTICKYSLGTPFKVLDSVYRSSKDHTYLVVSVTVVDILGSNIVFILRPDG